MLPPLQPMPLQKRPSAFDHPDWIFELKYDGFRALAYIEAGECRLVSRNGNQFKSVARLWRERSRRNEPLKLQLLTVVLLHPLRDYLLVILRVRGECAPG